MARFGCLPFGENGIGIHRLPCCFTLLLRRLVYGSSSTQAGRSLGDCLPSPSGIFPFFAGVHFVRLDEIVRLEAEDNYTHFLLKGGERITASRTIKGYEENLADYNFVRVHKKHIVNMNFMKTYFKGEGGYLVLDNGETIEVSRRKKSNLIEAVRRTHGEV